MIKTSLTRLSASFVFALPLVWLSSQQVSAQRNAADLTAFLLDSADCIASSSTSGSRYNSIYTDSEPVAINRQIFDRRLSIKSDNNGGSTSLSCRVNSRDFSTVDLQMGVTDGSAQSAVSMTVNIYQGGNLKHTYNNVQAGTMINVVLDLEDPSIPTNPNNFSVEVFDCNSNSYDCSLHFVEARLYPNGSFTSFSDSGETIGAASPSTSTADSLPNTTSSNPNPSSSQPLPSRQNTPSPVPTSSRQDPNPLDGVVDSFVDRLLDAIF